MRTRLLMAAMLLAALPGTGFAADCKLQLLDDIHMTRAAGGLRELVPVTINGEQKKFVFDTGGFYTQVSRPVVEELKLPTRQGRIQMYDLAGNISRDEASIKQIDIGHMRGNDRALPVSPGNMQEDGVLAIDMVYAVMDADIDFATDTLKFFSQDHCAGQVIWWTAPANAGVVPITMEGFHVVVPVMLDGKEERAVLDTGAGGSTLTTDEAKRVFGLTMGDADTPQTGVLNGDTTLPTYSHQFKTLSFGNVVVDNPKLRLLPNAVGRNADRAPLVNSRAQSEKSVMSARASDMIIGMDILRNLHVYIAFKERKLYVSSNPQAAQPAAQPSEGAKLVASLPPDTARTVYKQMVTNRLPDLEKRIAASPSDSNALAQHCFFLASAKLQLESASADCDKALKLTPNDVNAQESKALVLYQQGKYQESLDAYNALLQRAPNLATALFVRGYAKGRLGDQSGKDADLAAAHKAAPDIDARIKPMDID